MAQAPTRRKFKIPQFDPETGQGTLSSISDRFGVSQEQIVEANKNNTDAIPNLNDPDTIRAGASLTIPMRDQSQQATSAQRAQTEERRDKKNRILENRGLSDEEQEKRIEEIRKGISEVEEGISNIKERREEKEKKEEKPATETEKEGDEAQIEGDADLLDEEDEEQIEKIRELAEDEISTANDRLDSVRSLVDEANSSLISSIKQTYNARIEEMKEANRRALATKEQVGIRSGRSRFLPKMQQGILTSEELAGHQRIAKLEGEMLKAIAEVQQADADNQLDVFNDRMDRVEEIESNMQDEIQSIHDRAVEEHNQILEQKKEARRQQEEQRKQEEQTFEQNIDWAENVAPAVTSAMEEFSTAEEKVAFLQQFAEQSDRPFDILMGAVQARVSEEEAQDLLNESRRASTASSRSATAKRGQEMTETTREREMRSRIVSTFEENKRDNGTVPPNVWQAGRKAWLTARLPGDRFEDEFGGYQPPEADDEDLQ